MIRVFTASIAFCCVAWPALAQPVQPQPSVPNYASKMAVKKSASKAKPATALPAPTDSGPCRLGILSAIGDKFGVRKIGLTVFNNESEEANIDNWGLDDLVVAKVRAAAGPGGGVRLIAYAKGSFAPYDNPPAQLFRRADNDLTAIVRQVTANSNCERYVVVTKVQAEFGGTNQTVRGVSVVTQGIGDLVRHTYVVTNAAVTIFDGQSFAIRKPSISLETVMKRAWTGQRGPVREIDNKWYPASVAEAAASTKLRDESRALLAETLDNILPALLNEK